MNATAGVAVAFAVFALQTLVGLWLWFRGWLPGSPHMRGCVTVRWYAMGAATGMLNPGVVLWYAKRRGRLCRACFDKLTARDV